MCQCAFLSQTQERFESMSFKTQKELDDATIAWIPKGINSAVDDYKVKIKVFEENLSISQKPSSLGSSKPSCFGKEMQRGMDHLNMNELNLTAK